MPKILLVEDNEDNRDMLIRRLSRRGFEIIVAVDGAQGIDKAHSEMSRSDPDGYGSSGN